MNLQRNILEWLRSEVAAANTEISKSEFRNGMAVLLREAKQSPKPPDSYDKLEAICDKFPEQLRGYEVLIETVSTRTSWVCRIDRDRLDEMRHLLILDFEDGPYATNRLRNEGEETSVKPTAWLLLKFMWERDEALWDETTPDVWPDFPTTGGVKSAVFLANEALRDVCSSRVLTQSAGKTLKIFWVK